MIQTTIYASNRDTHQAAVKPNRLDCDVYSDYDSVSGYDSDYRSSGYRGHLTSSSLYCKPMLYCCAYSDYDSGNGYDSNINKRHLVAVISQTKYKLFYILWLCQWPWFIILPSDPSQRTHNAIMTQILRLRYVNTTSPSCWRSEDVIIASRTRWALTNMD